MNSAYIVAGSIYVCAWCVTLGGLSGAQHYCEDNAAMFDGVGLEILSPIAGSKCHRYFRFPWLILFASLLPLVMEALSMCKAGCGALGNKLCRIGGGVPLFAALLPLQFVMANVFYNLANAGAMGLLADRVKVRAACLPCRDPVVARSSPALALAGRPRWLRHHRCHGRAHDHHLAPLRLVQPRGDEELHHHRRKQARR